MSRGRSVFVAVYTGAVTLAVMAGIVQGLNWVKGNYGLAIGIVTALLITACSVGIGCLADIRKGLYQPRDLLRWPPIWLRSQRQPDKRQ